MEFDKIINYSGEISHIVLNFDQLLICFDNKFNATFFRNEKKSKEYQLEINGYYRFFKAVDSTIAGDFVAIYNGDQKKTDVYDVDMEKKELKKSKVLKWSYGVTEVVKFSPSGRFVATGGNDGRVIVYYTKNKIFYASLPKKNEAITSIDFHCDENLIAISTFKKEILIYDFKNSQTVDNFFSEDIVTKVIFLNKSPFIIYGCRDSKIYLYDYVNRISVMCLGACVNWPIDIFLDKNDNYFLASDKVGYLYFFDFLEEKSELKSLTNYNEPIVSIKGDSSDKIYFIFESKKIAYIDIKIQLSNIAKIISDQNMEGMYQILEQYPFFKAYVGDFLEKNEKLYNKRLELAMTEIALGNIDTASKIMGKVLTSPLHKEQFKQFTTHWKKVANFNNFYKNSNYKSAYELSKDSAFYKKLPFYKKMENHFNERFLKAIVILNSENGEKDVAYEDLRAFDGVKEKYNLVKALFKAPKKFLIMKNKYEQKNYKDILTIGKHFPIAKESYFYKDVIELKEIWIKDLILSLSKGALVKVIQTSNLIKNTFDNDDLKSFIPIFEKVNIVSNFLKAIESNSFSDAIAIVKENLFLINSNEYKKLIEVITKRVDNALIFCYKKDFMNMDKNLRSFLKNSYTRKRAVDIYRIYYLNQIEEYISKVDEKTLSYGIKSYVLRFGLDGDLEFLLKKYDKDSYMQEYENNKHGSFLKYKAVSNIFIGKTEEFK